MKKLLTLTIICFTLGVQAQTDSSIIRTIETVRNGKYIQDNSTTGQLGTGGIKFPNYNIRDTLKCWFKEAKEVVGFISPVSDTGLRLATYSINADTTLIETWRRGYMIVNKYGLMSKSQGKWHYLGVENYLYSDRKTVVKNTVLEHIEK